MLTGRPVCVDLVRYTHARINAYGNYDFGYLNYTGGGGG